MFELNLIIQKHCVRESLKTKLAIHNSNVWLRDEKLSGSVVLWLSLVNVYACVRCIGKINKERKKHAESE